MVICCEDNIFDMDEELAELDPNVTAYIVKYLGKPRINDATLFPLTVIYSVFLVVGLMGNMATCIVILNNEYMKTPTNVYLINLAVADMATLVLGKLKQKAFETF